MRKFYGSVFTVGLLASGFAVAPLLTDYHWENPVTGNWNSSTLWNPDGVPNGAGNSAIIDATGAGYTVVLNINLVDLDALVVDSPDATLAATGLSIGADSVSFLAGRVSLVTSTINSGTPVTNAANFDLFGSPVVNGGLVNSGTISILGASVHTAFTSNNGLTNSGTLFMNNSGGGYNVDLYVNGGSLTNSSGGLISMLPGTGGVRRIYADIVNNGTVTVNADGYLARNSTTTVNNGTWNVLSGAALTHGQPASVFQQNAGTLNVTGTFHVTGGADFEFNGGTISGRPYFSSSSLLIGPSSTGAGGFDLTGASSIAGNIAAAQSVKVFGNGVHTNVTAAGSFSNAGLIELESAGGGYTSQLTLGTGTLTNTGTLRTNGGSGGQRILATDLINSGTLQFNQATSFSKVNGVYTNLGQMTSPTTAVMSGSGQIFNQNGGTMDLTSGGFTIDSATFNFNGGTIIGRPRVVNSALTVSASGSGAVASLGSGTISGTIGSNKTVVVFGESVHTNMNSASGFTNNGALIMDASGGGYGATVGATTGTILNNGSFTTESGSGGTRTIAGNFTNAGTMTIKTPTSFSKTSGVYSNSGTINLQGPLAYTGLSQAFTQTSGLITGGDFFGVTSAVFNFNGGTINGQPRINAGTLNIGGGATGAASFMMLGSSTISGNIRAATTVQIHGNGAGSNALLTAASGFTNFGTMLMDSQGGGYQANFAVTAGTFTNAGTLTVDPGSGGTRTIAASLTNTGTININQPTSLAKTGATYTQAGGTINLSQVLAMAGAGQTFVVNAGSITGGDNLRINGATLNFNGGTISGQPRLDTSTLNIGAGATGAASFRMMGPSTITGDIKAATTVNVQGNGTGSNATLTAANSYSNAGTMLMDTADGGYTSTVAVSAGTLLNSGTFTVNQGAGGARTLAASFTNSGTVNVNWPLSISKANGVTTNSGGLFNVANTLSIVANNQAFRQTGGTLAASTNFNMYLGSFEYSGGTITGTPYLDTCTLTINGGAANPAQFRVGGPSTFVGSILAGHEVWVNGNGSGSNANLTSANGFSTAGTVRLQSTDGGYQSNLTVTNGLLTIQPSGKLLINGGSGGARTAQCTLSNNGLVEFNTAATLGRSGATHTNLGVFKITGGNSATVTGSTFNNSASGVVTGNGTLAIPGFNNGATVAPGLPIGKLSLTGTHNQTSTGAIEVDLNGLNQGTTYDWYAVSGAVTLNGKLLVRLLENFDPATGTEFTVITAPSITGTFSSLQLDKFPPNKSAEVLYSATSVKVRIKDGIRINADSYLVTIGEEFQGDLNSLFTTDNNSLSLFPDPVSQFAQIEITGTSTVTTPIAIRFSFEGRVERLGIAQATQMFNYTNNNWVFIDSRVGTMTDSAFDSNIGVNAPQFVGPAGIIKARVTWQPINDEDPTQDGWLHAIDVATWTLTE